MSSSPVSQPERFAPYQDWACSFGAVAGFSGLCPDAVLLPERFTGQRHSLLASSAPVDRTLPHPSSIPDSIICSLYRRILYLARQKEPLTNNPKCKLKCNTCIRTAGVLLRTGHRIRECNLQEWLFCR